MLAMADVAAEGHRDPRTRAHPFDHRVRRHHRARGHGPAPIDMVEADVAVSQPSTSPSRRDSRLASRGCRCMRATSTTSSDRVRQGPRAELGGQRHEPGAPHLRPAHFVPETKRVAADARDAGAQVPPGDRRGRVRRDRRPRHPRGSHRGVGGRDRRRVRRRRADRADPARRRGRGPARFPVDELNELLDADLPEGDWDTVGGLVFNVLGRVPAEGESVNVGRLAFWRSGCRAIASFGISTVLASADDEHPTPGAVKSERESADRPRAATTPASSVPGSSPSWADPTSASPRS